MRENEREVMQEMVDEYFERFVAVVTTHRPVKEPHPTQPLPEDYGGVYSGRSSAGSAVQLGLADGPAGWRTPSSSPSRRERLNAKAILYRRPYGYAGSIYAESQTPRPRANVLQLELPESRAFCRAGFIVSGKP